MSIQDRRTHDWFEYIYTREIFAWGREGGRITGCLGPYRLDEARSTIVEALDYDADTSLIEWAQANRTDFDLTG
jgi:hypothetical protein